MISSCFCFHAFKCPAKCRPLRARCSVLINPHTTRSKGCNHAVMLGGRKRKMIQCCSNFSLSSSALCTDALSHTTSKRLAGKTL